MIAAELLFVPDADIGECRSELPLRAQSDSCCDMHEGRLYLYFQAKGAIIGSNSRLETIIFFGNLAGLRKKCWVQKYLAVIVSGYPGQVWRPI